jgi:argininosuccinate synthase
MKAVLAYSGGLDTSVCVRILQEEYGCDVITATVNVGIDKKELQEAARKAKGLGVLKHYNIDATGEFARDYIFRAVKANGSYEGYPLSTALARPLIASKVVEIARKERAQVLAHGATGKGNDQFRFEAVFRSQAPGKRIIAPIREKNMTRKEAIAYARKHGIKVPVKKGKSYSIDENLWGRSIEGEELEDPGTVPPEGIFAWTKIRRKNPQEIEIGFNKGVPVSLNGEATPPVKLITELNKIAGAHGVGRIDMMEDRILGLKARENYECPAAVVLLKAHKQLESLVLSRRELRFKEAVDSAWSELVYSGLWTEPLRYDLDAFIDSTQERVTGTVQVRLHNKSCAVIARASPYALYSQEAVSFDDKTLDQREVEGMLKYHSLQAEMFARLGK